MVRACTRWSRWCVHADCPKINGGVAIQAYDTHAPLWRGYALVLISLYEWQLERLAGRLTHLLILVLGQFVQKLASRGWMLGKAVAIGQTRHRQAALPLFGIGLP